MIKDLIECGDKQFVYQICVKTLPIIQSLLTNDQYGQTTQKLKCA